MRLTFEDTHQTHIRDMRLKAWLCADMTDQILEVYEQRPLRVPQFTLLPPPGSHKRQPALMQEEGQPAMPEVHMQIDGDQQQSEAVQPQQYLAV